MADEQQFSLHEMENIKRRMAEAQASVTGPSSPSAAGPRPPAPPGNGAPPPGPEDGPAPQGGFSQHAVDADSLQLRRTLRVLRRHLLIILFIFVFIPALVAFIDLHVRDRIYRAVAVAERREPAALMLRRRLTRQPAERRDVNRLLGNAAVTQELAERLRDEVRVLSERLPQVSNPQRARELRELLGRLTRMVGTEGDLPAAFEAYRGALVAREVDEDVYEISVTGKYPRVHELVANHLVRALDAYARRQHREALEEEFRKYDELWEENQEQLRQLRRRIAEKNQAIDEMLRPAPEPPRDTTQQQLAQISYREAMAARLELSDLELQLRLEKEEIGWEETRRRFGLESAADIGEVLVSGHPLREQWRDLLEERSALQQRYTAEHPRRQSLQRRMTAVRQQMASRGLLRDDGSVPPLPTPTQEESLRRIRSLHEQVRLARARVEQLEAELARRLAARQQEPASEPLSAAEKERLQQLRVELEGLVEQQERDRAKGLQIYGWRSETRLLLNQLGGDPYYELSRAASARQISPQERVDIVLGAVLGLLLGVVVAFLLEHVDDRLHTPFDVYYHLRLNYLGVVPYWNDPQESVIDPEHPDSHIAEIYNHLRTNIRYGGPPQPEKCLLVASARPGEGKSTVSANLATSYALEGNTVLLVDADLRRPRGHKLIDIFEEGQVGRGLADYLNNACRFEESLYGTSIPGLSLMPAGARVRNAAKLTGSPRMRQVLAEAQEAFDVVIVDCPAVLPVVDATTLSPHVRGVLLVIAAEEVAIGAVRMAMYRLRHVGSPLVGAVLNKVRDRSTGIYYYGERGYGYTAYTDLYNEEVEEAS